MTTKKKNKAVMNHRAVRMPDSLWNLLSKKCSDKYPTTSDVIRKILWANVNKVIE